VIDSGASDITIPKDVYQTLVRSGTLTNADFIGTAQYGIADGSEVKGVKFKLASIQVGNQELKGLVGSVMPSDSATPLLGLSFLSHFRSWTIDNNSGTLRLTVGDDQTQVAAAGGSTQNSAPVVQPAPVAQPAPVQQAATDGSPQQASVNPAPAPQVIVVQQGTPGTPKQVADAGPTAIFEDGTHHAMRGGGDRAMVATASPQAAPALPTGVETAAAPAAVPAATPAPAEATPAATTAVAAPGMPLFPANTPYADARHSLMALGYGPAPLPDADKCDKDTDLTCFPEREACHPMRLFLEEGRRADQGEDRRSAADRFRGRMPGELQVIGSRPGRR
jgi:hypothetical protein